MQDILRNDALRIIKRVLSFRKADSVLSLIRQILDWIPFETDFRHQWSLHYIWVFSHI